MVSLLTALVGLSKALKQGSKLKRKGHRRYDDDLTSLSNGSAQLTTTWAAVGIILSS